MDTVTLGTSDLIVPPLCLGTMYFGTAVPVPTAHRLLDVALERGATFLDTANNYAFWVEGGTGDESELAIGSWLATRGSGVRDRVTLATKVGARPRPGGEGLDDALGLSATAVHEQVEDSLRRLGTDHVDLLYAHIDDRSVPLSETVGALAEVVRAGKARAVGCSNVTPERLRAAVTAAGTDRAGRHVAVQQRATYLTPAPGADFSPHVHLDGDLEREADALGTTVLGYSPLAGGAYTRADRPLPEGYRHPRTEDQLGALEEVAPERGVTRGQVVLAWMAHRSPRVLPVLGFSTEAQLLEGIDAVELTLDPVTMDRLEQARRP